MTVANSSADAMTPDPAAVLRGATQDACIAASIALLVFAAELALATLGSIRISWVARTDGGGCR